MLYESDDYSLDLRLDLPADAREGTVSGQLLKRGGEPVSNTAAYLISRGEIAADCVADDLGNFHMEFRRREALELWLLVDGTERIGVTLGAG